MCSIAMLKLFCPIICGFMLGNPSKLIWHATQIYYAEVGLAFESE